jgi:EmrB/QacA subfamily drug resistance transporter
VSTSSGTTTVDTFGIAPAVYQRRWGILAILNVSLVVIVMSVASLNNALPALSEALGTSGTQLQWIVDAYSLVFAGCLLPAGAIGDRFGRKGALLTGLAIFGFAALAASEAGSAGSLIVARSVMGLGAAFIMPATLSIIVSSFPMHERPKAVAIWAAFAGVGATLGPVASGLLLRHYWWGSVFFANIPLIVLLMAMAMLFVPSSKDPAGHPLDPVGAVLSVISLVALVFAVIEGPELGWSSLETVGGFAVAVVTGVAFVLWELRIAHPTLDPRLFKLRGFSTGALVVTIAFFSQFGLFFALTQYLQFVKRYSPLEAAVRQLPAAFMLMLFAPQSPRLVARFGVRKVVRAGFSLSATGFFLFSSFGPTTAYWIVLLGLVFIGAGIGVVMPPASQLIVGSLPLSKAGVGSAMNDVTREVGGALGIATLGSILASSYRSSIASASAALPEPARSLVRDSIAKAAVVAGKLPDRAAAEQVLGSAGVSFSHALTPTFVVAGGLALVAAWAIGSTIPDQTPSRVVDGVGPS